MKKRIFIVIVAICTYLVSNFCTGFLYISKNDDHTKYCGAGEFVSESETITYSRRETIEFKIKSEVPNYKGQISNANCANIAGTILIGYYDRFCEELIPDFKAYNQIGSVIKYKLGSYESEAVMSSLYTLMETNVGGAGTTFNGFHNGMRAYVSNHNYNYVTEDIGNLNFEKFKTSVENDKPVALFLNNYSFKTVGQDTGTMETIHSSHSTVAHVAIGYGYKVDTYYDSNNQIITSRTYLKVASGFPDFGLTYLCLDGKSKIDRATSVLIS